MGELARLIFAFIPFVPALILLILAIWVLISCTVEDEKEKSLIAEYKAHRSEFEQWLKYRDKTMRGDY